LLDLLNGKSSTHASLQDGDGGTLDLPRMVQSLVREEWTTEVIGVELVRLGAAPRIRWTHYRWHRRSYDIARRWPGPHRRSAHIPAGRPSIT